MRQVAIVCALLIALAVSASAGMPAGARGSAVRTVRVQGIDFHPRVLNVKRGDTVRWLFLDGDTPHNVASRGAKRFRSSPTKTSGSWSVRFSRKGTFRYVCTIHLNMRARVVVT